MSDLIYLDHAAATPLDPAVLEAMTPYLHGQFFNPSSLYEPARKVHRAVEQARAQVANLLGAKPTEIVWTSGGTESVNLAIQGVMRTYSGAHWVTTAIEHESVLAIRAPLSRAGHEVTTIGIKPNGIVDSAKVVAAITDATVLVSVMMANNEIGTIQPVAELGKLVAGIRRDRSKRGIDLPLYLHTDACQASPYLDLHVSRLGVDLLSLNGSKVYGPKGVGLLYVRTGTKLEPLQYGGRQERGRRSGTENVAGIVGLAKALELAVERRAIENRRIGGLRDQLLCTAIEIPDAIVNGDMKRRLPNNLNLSFPGADGQTLVLHLAQAGILVGAGSACTSVETEPSHVLLALGSTPDEASSSVRFTLGRGTTVEEIKMVTQWLPKVVRRVRELGQT